MLRRGALIVTLLLSVFISKANFRTTALNFSPIEIEDPVPFPKTYYMHPLFDKAMACSQANDFANAEPLWESFVRKYPDVWQGYFYLGSAQVRLSKGRLAYQNFEIAYQMNPFDSQLILDYIYSCALVNDKERALFLADQIGRVSYSTVVSSNGQWFNTVVSHHGSQSQEGLILSAAHDKMLSTHAAIRPNDVDYASIDTLMKFTGGQYLPIWNAVKGLNTRLKKRGLNSSSYHFFLTRFHTDVSDIKQEDWKNWLNIEIVKEYLNEYRNQVKTNDYYTAILGLHQYEQYFGSADYDRAYVLISKLIEDLSEAGIFRHKLIELYQKKARLLYFMDRNTEFAAVAESLEVLAEEYENPNYRAKSYELICLMNKDSNYEKAILYGEKALTLSKKNDLGLETALESLLAITHFDNGNTDKGLEYAGVNKDNLGYAEYFNVASMMQDNDELDLALEYFLKSYNTFNAELVNSSPREKLTLRGKMNDLYNGLVECYYDLGNKEEVFNVLEKTKGQTLANNMGIESSEKITLEELQGILGAEEAFISYKITQQAIFTYVAVTHDRIEMNRYNMKGFINPIKKYFGDALKNIDEKLSQAEYRTSEYQPIDPESNLQDIQIEEGDFELVIEFFRKHLTGELGEFMPTFQEEGVKKIGNVLAYDLWNNFLSGPQEQIGFKKKLYLSLDGALNFLPFESLKDGDGKYVAETQEVCVVPSASILALLKKRKYSSDRKEIVAMGGAVYEEAQSDVPVNSTLSELYDWQLKSYDLVKDDQPLTDLFKALGYGKMNYLPGTLSEVQKIDSLFEDALLITGSEMTEKKVKTLSESGELKKYKVVHFATHGWVINSMPAVSGLAMCIPAQSIDGEDGRLISKEIAALDLNADMVMLSACQTGLGKLYGGEAVEGLNQSLLIAGANSTIVSLWPVNDFATSIMVSEMYRLTKEKSLSYSEALTQVKRNFIKGIYNTESYDLTDPIYWAPFVYNGG